MLEDDKSNRPRSRTALIDLELESIKTDITALQEVRMSGEGQLRETVRTIFWKGVAAGQPRRAGVGFALKNTTADKLTEQPKGISERMITLRLLPALNRNITIINVYAPTMDHQEEEKKLSPANFAHSSQESQKLMNSYFLVTSMPESDLITIHGGLRWECLERESRTQVENSS